MKLDAMMGKTETFQKQVLTFHEPVKVFGKEPEQRQDDRLPRGVRHVGHRPAGPSAVVMRQWFGAFDSSGRRVELV
jgi:hypothetical protein